MTQLAPRFQPRSRSAVGRPSAVAGALAAAVAADVAFDPVHNHVPLCPFHSVTGLWCPFCGGLRAVDSLAHGRFVTAFHDNALLLGALPLLALYWLDWTRRARADEPGQRLPRWVVRAGVVITVGFWVVRNLPFATALRPT